MSNHAMKIFFIFTLILLLHFIVQLLTYDTAIQPLLYPAFSFVLSYLLFYVPPAIVIDNSSLGDAIIRSVDLSVRKPLLIVSWLAVGVVLVVISKIIGDLLLSGLFSQYLVLLLNSIVFLPFLIILQTQMYMEKYPLAR